MASGFFHCVSEITSLLELSLPTYPVFPSSSILVQEENQEKIILESQILVNISWLNPPGNVEITRSKL